ncbi:DUF4402 domain-containing protein [Altererythrobacter sp. MTPC7]|uniref:DUF4402 domain-containing protein n=1 Tax=Altererythrobacter sp. MTPC7 TaxID=3056567 RepID=UPI0036F44402
MKMFFRGAASTAIAAVAFAAMPAMAQTAGDPNANQADADARAEILAGLTLTNVAGTSLDFGSIIVLGAGTVTVPSDGSAATCPAASFVCAGATDVAEFEVTGSDGKAVSITLPDAAATVGELEYDDGVNPVHTIDITEFETNAKLDSATPVLDPVSGLPAVDPISGDPLFVQYDGVLLTGGTATFPVGGSIALAAGQEPGLYEHTFTVEVNYN